MADIDCDTKYVGERGTCCVCDGHDCEEAKREREKHPTSEANAEPQSPKKLLVIPQPRPSTRTDHPKGGSVPASGMLDEYMDFALMVSGRKSEIIKWLEEEVEAIKDGATACETGSAAKVEGRWFFKV